MKYFVLTKPHSAWSETRDSPVLPTPPLFLKYVCETLQSKYPISMQVLQFITAVLLKGGKLAWNCALQQMATWQHDVS